MKLKYYIVLLTLTSACISGCGGKAGVSGIVSFPDGSPLTQGFVIFENGSNQVSGTITETGYYQMGENGNTNGIKPDEYKVRIISESGGGSDGEPFVRYIADKYDNVNTSGLVCEVKGNTVFNITVTKPEK
ncbi:MAG: hypothetical protein LBU34_18175 [Planctomycetaceae bacterium]|jgi:hypothetical protein|nr:hypothetical protein [Planctomycetaceae bacterium]